MVFGSCGINNFSWHVCHMRICTEYNINYRKYIPTLTTLTQDMSHVPNHTNQIPETSARRRRFPRLRNVMLFIFCFAVHFRRRLEGVVLAPVSTLFSVTISHVSSDTLLFKMSSVPSQSTPSRPQQRQLIPLRVFLTQL